MDQRAHRKWLATPHTPVRISCAIRGTTRPPLRPDDPFAERVAGRVGVELEPIGLDNPDDVAWLRALVWPEQRERASRLDHAIAIAKAAWHRSNISIWRGDGAALLPRIAAELADGEALCVVHSFTLNQFHPMRGWLSIALLAMQRRNETSCGSVSNGGAATRRAQPHPLQRVGGKRRDLARCDAHGSWVEWLEV